MFSCAIVRLPETFSRNARRLDDAEGDEGIDEIAPAVADLDADILDIEAEQPIVDELHRVDESWSGS